jgi:hypothetical protein
LKGYDRLGDLAKISHLKEAAVSDLGSESGPPTERRRPFIGRKKLASQRPQPGVYRHYKGQLYEVIETALHVDTNQALVVYRALYGEGNLWVRPRSAFIGAVEIDGVKRPRFQKVEIEASQQGEH